MQLDFLKNIIDILNSIIWSNITLIIFALISIYFTVRLKFFQVLKQSTIWKSMFKNNSSKNGISSYSSFWTAMSTRIGIGNVAGVAIAIYNGGPGVLFWIWIYGFFCIAITFVESTLAQLYKRNIDNEYRGSNSICAKYGLGIKKYSIFVSIVFGIVTGLLLPAAETFTLCDCFHNASNVPSFIIALIVASIFAFIIFGGIRRIAAFSGIFAAGKVILFLSTSLLIICFNLNKLPEVFGLIFQYAFAPESAVWGGIGTAFSVGFRRCQFACNPGMGESMPSSASAESYHPCEQGFYNTCGAIICVFGVCTFSGLIVLLTNSYTNIGNLEPGISSIQSAYSYLFGIDFANWFVSAMILLFVVTGLVGYYYESETSLLYLFKTSKSRKIFVTVWKILIILSIVFYGSLNSNLAWGISDFSLGFCVIINLVVIVALSPKVFLLYKDYDKQKKFSKHPKFINKYHIKGVDETIWPKL